MNTRLIQQYAIIGAEEAVEVVEKIDKSHHAFLLNLSASEYLKQALKEYNELMAVFELLVAEVYGDADQDLDLLISHVVVTEHDKKTLRDAVQGIRLSGANSDICKFLMAELFLMSKAFSKIARFGLSTFDPDNQKLAFHRIVAHSFLITESMKALMPNTEIVCPEVNAEKKKKVNHYMSITHQAGLL